MRSILSMFAKSPFGPLTSHIDKVRGCVDLLKPLFEALERQDYHSVKEIGERIIKMEYDADVIKNGIRSHLPQSIFLPVDKRDFMHLLSAQDDIADAVEDLAVLLRIKNLVTPDAMKDELGSLVSHVIHTGNLACDLICELDNLMEAAFGGAEAERVEKAADNVATAEWEADKKQFVLAQKLFSLSKEIDPADLLLWNEVLKKLGAVADEAEKIGKILCVFLSK